MKRLLSGFVLGLFSTQVYAIVNLDSLHFQNNKAGIFGTVGLGLSGASGNTDKSLFSFDSQLKWNSPRHSNFLLASYQYGESNDVRDTNNWFVHARHIHDSMVKPQNWEMFAQVERNEFTRLSYRGLFGAGMRWRLMQNPQSAVANIAGAGAFYSREELEENTELIEDRTQDVYRGNFYLLTKYALSKSASFVNTLYYQPDLEALEDYRVLEVATLKTKINQDFSLSVKLSVSHDSQPPLAVEKTDSSYVASLEYAF